MRFYRNTAHLWHHALQEGTPLPILHIVDAVTEAPARACTVPASRPIRRAA